MNAQVISYHFQICLRAFWIIGVFIFSIGNFSTTAAERFKVQDLRCEYEVNPIGIDNTQPRLSWVMESAQRGQYQTAYQILVSTSLSKLKVDDADLWDSGKVSSDQSIHVKYQGKPLTSRLRCYWKVRVWDASGVASRYSLPAFWEVGMSKEEWTSQWIGFTADESTKKTWQQAKWIWFPEGNPASTVPVAERYFRRQLVLPASAPIRKAICRVTADDQCVIFINGQEAGRSSGKSYAWKILNEIDIQKHLSPGTNWISISVTNQAAAAGLLGQFVVEFESEPALAIVTDLSWKTAKQVGQGWQTEPLDDRLWIPAQEVALVGEGPWQGVEFSPMGPAPFLRKGFGIAKPVRQARLYSTALGVYEFYLNGHRVGSDVFTPGWTDYKRRVQYQTYDVTAMLRKGTNAMGAILGDGWYSGYVGLGGRNRYGSQPLLRAQLIVDYTDNTFDVFATDRSWKAAVGPIVYSDMLMGEFYDARKEFRGWNIAGYNDSAWQPVLTQNLAVLLESTRDYPVRKLQELKVQSIAEPQPGTYIFDLGQNMVGWARLRVKGPSGKTITLRYGEMLNPDGTLYTQNLRSAKCTDRYILKGGPEEIFEPHFTFHGFRYVEVTGLPGRPNKESVTGIVIGSNLPVTGKFESGIPLLNRLYGNIMWSQRGNFLSIPTDCPQRDERLGWMGDAMVFLPTAAFNMDVARFFSKWMVDVIDAQTSEGAFTDVSPSVAGGAGTAAWGDAGVICPWTLYTFYGDKQILEQCYPAGVRWIDYLKTHSNNGLRPAEGYGDWLAVGVETPKDVLATAFYARSVWTMARMAEVLGKTDDIQKYDRLFQEIRTSFNQAYVQKDGKIIGHTQTGYVLALEFDLLPVEGRPLAAKHLVDNIESHKKHLTTGFAGTSHLLSALSNMGYNDIAYQLMMQETFPSWLYPVKLGATTIWERWDGWTPNNGFQNPSMNSFNHYAFGAVGEWMYRKIAGIGLDPQLPAGKHLIIHPIMGGGLTYARGSFDSMYGKVSTYWRILNRTFDLEISIPPNTTATVYLPGKDKNSIKENGAAIELSKGIQFVKTENGWVVFNIGSGKYEFTALLQ